MSDDCVPDSLAAKEVPSPEQGGPGIVREDFGFQSVQRSHQKYIKNSSDMLMIWLHYVLLRNRFKTMGGDYQSGTDLSEHLPRNLGWNGDKQAYYVKYENNRRVFGFGVYIRNGRADCSMVTLQKSIKIGIPISDVIDEDMQYREEVMDHFTDVLEKEFVCPLLMRVENDPVNGNK